jgi:hypothetical protein
VEKRAHVRTKSHQVPLQLADYLSTRTDLYLVMLLEVQKEQRMTRPQPDVPEPRMRQIAWPTEKI